MQIVDIRVGNYKSLLESPKLVFSPGINVITGQNNAGKTALLEAISLAFAANPHRSPRTVPTPLAQPDPTSWVEVTIRVTSTELKWHITQHGNQVYVPLPDPGGPFAKKIGYQRTDEPNISRLLESILAERYLTFELRLDAHGGARVWTARKTPSFGLYDSAGKRDHEVAFATFRIKHDGSVIEVGSRWDNVNREIGPQLAPHFQQNIYKFTAERFNVGEGPFGNSEILSPNAVNLPEVLNVLQSNPAKYRKFNEHVSQILPQVRWVSVRSASNNRLQILVWMFDPADGRDDLTVPLNQSGSGIGQVLAMLYVTMNSNVPRVVIIDEPQSFLHPGAIHKLIEILRMHPQHQCIVTTHSPTVVAAARPGLITLADYSDGKTTFQQLPTDQTESLRQFLDLVGARLSDVFGADRILWVEGLTEERAFALIAEKLLKVSLMGTRIIGIRNTGDLQGRDAKKVFEIYNRLTEGNSLLPRAIAFILDPECRSVAEKAELEQLSQRRLRFLKVRMFENYLLNSAAITSVVNGIEGFARPRETVSEEQVLQFLEQSGRNERLYCPDGRPADDASGWRVIDGARVLADLFARLSETRVSFEKSRDSIALTNWIIEHSPQDFQEISDLLKETL